MLDWLIPLYPWLRALHVISVISWMAGLLYLPRLFVYHCTVEPGSEASETFKVMEWKLSRYIMNPAMIASFVFGLLILAIPGYFANAGGWLHLKLVLVLAMGGLHFAMMRWRDDFAADRNSRPDRFYRIANEMPTLLMIAIVILVIVKPF